MSDTSKTPADAPKFDFAAYPADTCFYDRRSVPVALDGRPDSPSPAPAGRRLKKERRRRIDPTTFEKQYTAEDLEFMTAMQRFKVRTGKAFPSYAEVLEVAESLGYRREP